MASAVVSLVLTSTSCFALQVDSSSDSDSEKTRGTRGSGKSRPASETSGKSNNNEKKRENRKKKKEQHHCEANELSRIPLITKSVTHTVSTMPAQDDWKQWRQRDKQLTSDMFETDMVKALIISKMEYEERKTHPDSGGNGVPQIKRVNQKDKRMNIQGKDKPLTVSLKDFQSEEQHTKKTEDLKSPPGPKLVKQTELLKLEIEKKDTDIQQPRLVISEWEAKYKEMRVKEGEMKDKAVTALHVALEQERSRGKILQAEQVKYQGIKKGKRCSESDHGR
uniref:Uncharacterized protein n=1 Tax=Leptobrachium leishanense TaxID=445787 RepID=A0A8C5M393_9ANUR